MSLTVHLDYIAAKAAHITEQITGIEQAESNFLRVGGATTASFADEISFQDNRLAILSWAAEQDVSTISARYTTLVSSLGANADYLYGDVSGLAQDDVDRIVEAELLDIALGLHPLYILLAVGS